MNLSEYCEKNVKTWDRIEIENANRIVNYVNNVIDLDLYEVAKTNNNLEVYKRLCMWLLNFYEKQLKQAIEYANIDYVQFQKDVIYSFILGITRTKPNIQILYETLKKVNIIHEMIVFDDGTYKIATKEFGNIYFSKAEDNFSEDIETLEYIRSLGDYIKEGCHQITYYIIQKYDFMKAVTSINTRALNKKCYHSFLVDDVDNIVDLTANLVMPKKTYYLLNSVIELNCISYNEYLTEKDDSIKYDESKTLFELLRNALYKQYTSDNNDID